MAGSSSGDNPTASATANSRDSIAGRPSNWQRPQVTALARQPAPPLPKTADASQAPVRSPARTLWAVLLARIFEVLPLRRAHPTPRLEPSRDT
jgi:hypothetical protein